MAAGQPLKVREADKAAAEWLEQRDLASCNPKGRLVIHSAALVFSTSLGNVERVRDPPELINCSLWSLRRRMLEAGWTEAESGKASSVESKLFNKKSEHSAYYAILLERNLAIILGCLLTNFYSNFFS